MSPSDPVFTLSRGLGEARPKTRRTETITLLLERYSEFVDPMQAGNGDGDTGLRRMPATYTASVRELERLLLQMRAERRSQYWHLTERYIRCTKVTRDVPVKRKGPHGKTVTDIERRVITIWNPAVRLEKVRRGVDWLAAEWRLPIEPELPTCQRCRKTIADCPCGLTQVAA